jgi:hypothetical protein
MVLRGVGLAIYSDQIINIANKIEAYLSERKNSADTLEGITRWWLLQQTIWEAEEQVRQALMYLCEEGKIQKKSIPGGADLLFYQQRAQPIARPAELQDGGGEHG